MAITSKQRGLSIQEDASQNDYRQRGSATAVFLGVMVVAVLTVFGLVYCVFSIGRENMEQTRIARSAAVVALKAYVRAGLYPTPIPQRRQIVYALDAAARVVDVETGSSNSFDRLTEPSISRVDFEKQQGDMPPTAITINLDDKRVDQQGRKYAGAVITLGAAGQTQQTRLDGSSFARYSLGGFSGDWRNDTLIGVRVRIRGLSSTLRTIDPDPFLQRSISPANYLPGPRHIRCIG